MKYYVYQITNLITGKIYVGKRKHTTPETDQYMGSGKLIKAAIKKYGIAAFEKEILQIFDVESDAFQLESQLVTIDFISRKDTYNLHEGGYGGFAHINSLPIETRPNLLALKANLHAGITKCGGTDNWSDLAWEKVRVAGERGQKIACERAKLPQSIEKRKQTYKDIQHQQGDNNSQFGTHVYLDPATTKLPTVAILNGQRYKIGVQPCGWISIDDWREAKKNKHKAAYGKHWYNNGNTNYYYHDTHPAVIELGLVRGRLNCKFGK